jgi:hypothetical protein
VDDPEGAGPLGPAHQFDTVGPDDAVYLTGGSWLITTLAGRPGGAFGGLSVSPG